MLNSKKKNPIIYIKFVILGHVIVITLARNMYCLLLCNMWLSTKTRMIKTSFPLQLGLTHVQLIIQFTEKTEHKTGKS